MVTVGFPGLSSLKFTFSVELDIVKMVDPCVGLIPVPNSVHVPRTPALGITIAAEDRWNRRDPEPSAE